MRSKVPTIILNRDEAAQIADAFNATYAAATQEGTYTAAMHADYEAKRATFARKLSKLTGVRNKSDEFYRVEDALSDNGPLDIQGVTVAFTLTDHNMVVDGKWFPAGTGHYVIREALR